MALLGGLFRLHFGGLAERRSNLPILKNGLDGSFSDFESRIVLSVRGAFGIRGLTATKVNTGQ